MPNQEQTSHNSPEPIPIEKINTIEIIILRIQHELCPILKQVNVAPSNKAVEASTSPTLPSDLNHRLDQLIYRLEELESLIDL